jgi:hypothetical protein
MGDLTQEKVRLVDTGQSAQQVADHFEQANVERYATECPARTTRCLEAILIDAIRVVESRMRLELALAQLSRSRIPG